MLKFGVYKMGAQENKRIFQEEVRVFQQDLAKVVSGFHKKIFNSDYDDELKVNIIIGSCTAAIRNLFGMMGFLGIKYFSEEDIKEEFISTMEESKNSFYKGIMEFTSQDKTNSNVIESKPNYSLKKLSREEKDNISQYVSSKLSDITKNVSNSD